MTDQQRHLFRMPSPRRIELSPTQREVLAWVEFSDGQYSAWPRRFQPATLRSLIDQKLVKIISYSPGRYMITPLGRAVRSRYADQAQKPAGKPPLITQMFFRDADD
jgi:hypothetical protein